EDYAVTVTPAADVGVTASAVPAVAVGSNLTFTVTVVNNGPSTANSVKLTNQLSGPQAFVSVNSSRGSCSQNANTISCDLGQMLEAATASVTITVLAQQTGTISNQVQVTANETDVVAANN